MAIKPKSAVFQIRIDPDLLDRFQQQCADREIIPSAFVRRVIRDQSEHWAKQASGSISPSGGGSTPSPSAKTAPAPVKSSGKGKK